MANQDIRNLTRRELAGALGAAGEKPSRADKLFNCLYRKGAASFAALDVNEALKAKLQERFTLEPRPVPEKRVSALDSTVKLLLRFADGAPAECVTLRNKDNLTFCLSSQSGCACGCTFCATGALGLRRSLTPSEITAQFEACRAVAGAPDSVVFMGMGEPFFNWDAVKKSIEILSDNKGLNFPQTRITVSTVGVIPVIDSLAKSGLKINLAVSVITADPAQRAALTPMEKKYPLPGVIHASRRYCQETKRKVFFEYILFDGVNDGPADAQRLLALIKDIPCKVNLILYNPAAGAGPVPAGRAEKARAFQRLLIEGGLRAHLRHEKGADIAAACGQLAGGNISAGTV